MWRRRFRVLRSRAVHFMDKHATASFSQEGEDIILQRLLEGRTSGRYVDVGAHHPSRFSNTRLLYDSGWRGLNVDALPGSMQPFRSRRRGDVNIEAAVGSVPGSAVFWQFQEPALSTLEEAVALERIEAGHALLQTVDLPVLDLASLIDEHLGDARVDLLTVDVEGRDLDVLRSLDWDRQAPAIVCVESTGEICDLSSGPAAFLVERGYRLYAATGLSRIFVRRVEGGSSVA